jgi:capsular exopolysaccharide synthesis family protein
MSGGAPTIDLREIFRVLMRRKALLFIPWSVAVLAGTVAAFMLKPVYYSSVTLLLESGQQLSGNLGGMVGGTRNADTQADVMREQVKSSVFLRGVLTATGVRTDPATRTWALKSAKGYGGDDDDEIIDRFLVNYLRDGISIRRGKGNVFEVTVGDFDRERAQKFAAGVSNQFIESSKAAQLDAVRTTFDFSQEQQKIYKVKLEEAEARLESFRRNAASTTMLGSSVGASNLPKARALLDQATFESEDLRQRVESLRSEWWGKARENDPLLLSTSQVNALIGQLVSLERQLATSSLSETAEQNLAGMRLSLVRKHSELEVELGVAAARTLPNLAPAVRDKLVAYRLAQADLAGVDARRQWFAGQVAAYERDVVATPDREIELNRLIQDVDNNRALYNSFLQQSAAAQIREAFENAKVSGRFVILEPANRPIAPGKPNRPALILLAIFAGGVIGVGTVLVVEQHDQSMRNADEVESLLGLQVLGAVPRVAELERSRRKPRAPGSVVTGVPAPRDHGLLHRLKVESPLGLEFRRIYLKLAKSRGRALPRTLVVTSSTRGEGKTTTTACLAITLARELRQKILLVDFDLRSPALHRALGLPSSSWGLAQMLQQRHFDERFVKATVLPHLEFLPAGKSERPAAELVDSESVEWFLKEATSRYALVLLDAPPNLAVPDPLILGRAVEGVLYVIKAGSTVRKAAEYGVKVQREAKDNLIGVLINDSGEILPSYYGYRYNYYGYTNEVAGGES